MQATKDYSEQANRIISLLKVSDKLPKPGQMLKLAADGFYHYDGLIIRCFACKVNLDLEHDIINQTIAHHENCQRGNYNKPYQPSLPRGFLVYQKSLPMKDIHG